MMLNHRHDLKMRDANHVDDVLCSFQDNSLFDPILLSMASSSTKALQ